MAGRSAGAPSAIIVLTDIWLWTPWFTLLLLAGLQSLPKEPFEAAAIDGTSTWRVFRHLTLPMLRPVIVVCVVIRAIDAFRTFDIVWTLTGGGPGALDRAVQPLRLRAGLPQSRLRPRLGGGDHRRRSSSWWSASALYRLLDRVAKVIRWRWSAAPLLFARLPPGGAARVVRAGADRHLLAVRLSRCCG